MSKRKNIGKLSWWDTRLFEQVGTMVDEGDVEDVMAGASQQWEFAVGP